jgi:hypothetical protein
MGAHDPAPADDAPVAGTPSAKAQGDTRTDAADPKKSARQHEHRVGSAGGGPYPIGSKTDNEGAER